MGNLALAIRHLVRQDLDMTFRDRIDAGSRLGALLVDRRLVDPVVVGLPRGGVVVAAEAARLLQAPLDVVIVRKLGAPGRSELGIGAIGEDGIRALNDELIHLLGVSEDDLAAVEEEEHDELARRVAAYRRGRDPVPVSERTVVVIDDGLATGYTARAALRVLRRRGAARLILAVPVSARDTAHALEEEADEVIVLHAPFGFGAVGQWYEDFRQTTDDEVLRLLDRFRPGDPDRPVQIPIDHLRLPGALSVPANPRGIVVFAHGSGSSRHSPRNQAVAGTLQEASFGTLLFDLLTESEADHRTNVFDISLLADRLVAAVSWLRDSGEVPQLPFGLFGASTGAAAAIIASMRIPVEAVVSRGGRPDLAGSHLATVTTPVLLIVGSRDHVVLELNETAAATVAGPCEVAVIPGAGHLFEESGTLEQAAGRATEWFERWML